MCLLVHFPSPNPLFRSLSQLPPLVRIWGRPPPGVACAGERSAHPSVFASKAALLPSPPTPGVALGESRLCRHWPSPLESSMTKKQSHPPHPKQPLQGNSLFWQAGF